MIPKIRNRHHFLAFGLLVRKVLPLHMFSAMCIQFLNQSYLQSPFWHLSSCLVGSKFSSLEAEFAGRLSYLIRTIKAIAKIVYFIFNVLISIAR